MSNTEALRAAAHQALAAMEKYPVTVNHWKAVLLPAADALRAALAQQPAASGEPAYKVTVVDDDHPAGIPYEQWVRPKSTAQPAPAPAPGYCKHCKQYTIDEPLPAEPAPARVPPGWQLVPVEPTPAMLEAVKPFPHHLTAGHPDPADRWHWRMAAATKADQMRFASEYREALAAAPTAQPTRAEGE